MGRRKEKIAKLDHDDEAGDTESSKAIFMLSDSDDEAEANEDLSLRIVEKAISRASSGFPDRTGSGVHDSGAGTLSPPADDGEGAEDIVTSELVAVEKSAKKKKVKKERWRKRKSSAEAEVQTVVAVEEGQKASETVEEADSIKKSEQGAPENSDNAVLRRLLRGPRYFDPPDSSWGACFNCGEAGHSAVNCTVARRKKPCFVCGSFEHGAKQCVKGRDCFICKEGGHQAKDCPKKYKKGGSQGSNMCLKCGSSGHDMFFCSNDYSPDDLKDIQCYVCKSFGHLCCVNYSSAVSTDELSCYKCGQPGHTGLACRGSRGDTTGAGSSPSSCFKCGVEGHFARECIESTNSSCYVCGNQGHFARECTNSTKVKKRGRERDHSTPRKKPSKEHKEDKGYKSAPQDHGKGRKKKKLFDEEWSKSSSSSKKRPRGGWIVEDPGDYDRWSHDRWRSPSTPTGKSYRTPNHSDRSPYSNPWSSKMDGNSYNRSQGHSNSYQHQHEYSASRFGNSGYNSGNRRSYEW